MISRRKELKYIINDNDFYILNHNLKDLLKKDSNCKGEFYTISSIYFDTYNKTSYRQVKEGISNRWKYRIRYYNYDDSYIKLEKKHKINNLTKKDSIIISKKILNDILNNNIKINNENSPLLNEFAVKMQTELLRPIICIEYDRIPYVYKDGNVRITLDFNVRYTNNDIKNEYNNVNIIVVRDILVEKFDKKLSLNISLKLTAKNIPKTSYLTYQCNY